MNNTLNTFIQTLKCAVFNKETLRIDGADFSSDECKEILRAIQAQQNALDAANLLCANLRRGGNGHMTLVDNYEILCDRI